MAGMKEPMGHSSIQVTVDTYGYLIRGANIPWPDQLDRPAAKPETETSPQLSATKVQPAPGADSGEQPQVIEIIGGPAWDRTRDRRIMSPLL